MDIPDEFVGSEDINAIISVDRCGGVLQKDM